MQQCDASAPGSDVAGPYGDLVSVVIPTKGRPRLLQRAVRTALGQTWPLLEVVVVVDGADPASMQSLSEIRDARLRVIELAVSGGAQNARNRGVCEARGAWIAFLDDDDEWLPQKIERQIAAARAAPWRYAIVSCGLIEAAPERRIEWPRRPPRANETISDYLFRRSGEEMREIRLQTSTLVMPRELLLQVPWRTVPNDEWDLLLRAARVEGAGLAFAPGAYSIWHSDSGLERLSRKSRTWRDNQAWFYSMRAYMSPRAYSDFLLSTLSTWAHRELDYKGAVGLLWEAVRHGQPTLPLVVRHVLRWTLPKPIRDAARLAGNRSQRWA